MTEINHTGIKKTDFIRSRKTGVFMILMSICINPKIVYLILERTLLAQYQMLKCPL